MNQVRVHRGNGIRADRRPGAAAVGLFRLETVTGLAPARRLHADCFVMVAAALFLVSTVGCRVETAPSTDAPDVIRNSIGMGLKLLSGGTFTMGEALIDEDRQFERHVVTLTRPFFIGTHEVTNAQWKRVMGNVPSYAKGSDHPVERVSWEDAMAFCNALSDLPEERKAGRVYRLPTEAEWEYACRAGTTTRFSFGDEDTPDSRMGEYSWYLSNSGSDQQGGPDKHAPNVTHPVGTKRPNPWGLYDMDGNVREWCSDWFSELDIGPATDPQGPAAGTDRATRGGYFSAQIWDARPARRYGNPPTTKSPGLGFRVAVTALPGSATEAADRRAD